MAQESESVAPIVETRKVVIQYTINAPNVATPTAGVDPAALERFILAVMSKNSLGRTPL